MSFPESVYESDAARPVLSVADLTGLIKDTLEGSFPDVWVAGEISNLSRPQSGHCYLTLKDDRAQIRAVLWRATATRCKFELEDGLEVICQGELEVYPPRGTYQLVVRQIEPRGVGALELALRKLREKLAAEGLFDQGRKRPLPRFPRRIAFVTSPTGAAIRDFLQVLRRRWTGADVLVVPTRVQGDGAGAEIAAAIATANRFAESIDCLVVGRGGGSLEDLWAFNEECVVRAICASRIPVVSAVGHEIDVTLSDLAADVRALTPSEAAELVVPASDEIAAALRATQMRLLKSLRVAAGGLRTRLEALAQHRGIRRPFEPVHERAQRIDDLAARAKSAIVRQTAASRQRLTSDSAHLESLSPLAVLGRGYSLTFRTQDGQLVRDAANLQIGDEVVTRFAKSRATSTVTGMQNESAAGLNHDSPADRID
ncbi:MAG TPA: exodeoxyribonuclease VII large subunit [Pirellulales bacterium]|nr:exodeoxyribonuclease VII large subunit [Pirellulales bacterium]